MEEVKKNDTNEKNLENFAKNLEQDFKNFGENDEKSSKKENVGEQVNNNNGYTIRSILALCGEGFLENISKIPDKYFFKLAISSYSEEVQKRCKVEPSFNSVLANIQADAFKKVLMKYNWDLDIEISEEAVLAVSSFARCFGAYYEGKKIAEKIQADIDLLRAKQDEGFDKP